MRVVILTSFIPGYTTQLANEISKTEEVRLILPENLTQSEFGNTIISDRIDLIRFNRPRNLNPKWFFTVLELKEIIDEYQPDIVHIQADGDVWFFLLYQFIKRYHIVDTLHDVTPHIGSSKFAFWWMRFFALRYSEHFFVHGKYLKKKFLEQHEIDSEHVTEIRIGGHTHLTKLGSSLKKPEKNTILFFGRLMDYKGLKYLLQAEPLVSRLIPNLKIILAVHGDPIKKYDKFFVNKERYEIIEKFVPENEAIHLFERSCFVVLPYIEASQSGVISSYSFPLGRTVITTKIGGLVDVVKHKETGLLVEPRNVTALANAIIKLLRNPTLLNRLNENAFNYITAVAGWKITAKKTIDVYNKKLNRVAER